MVTTYQYLDGTERPITVTRNGEVTSYTYDYRHRVVQTTTVPQNGETLTSKNYYVNNLLFATEDAYGRKQYRAYRASDTTLIRTVDATVPEFSLASFDAVLNLTRNLNANAQYLVTDSLPNAAGEHIEIVDPRGNRQLTTLDSRGRAVVRVEAADTAVAATTETDYDAAGNVVAVRSPRYFDSADTLGYQQASETFTYTRRNLKATHTVAAGAQDYVDPDNAGWSAEKVRVTESWAYNLDRTLDTHTDFRGNGWQSLWSSCCAGRLVAQNDPLGAATTMAHDAQGNVTLSQKVHGLTIFNQQTARFDARNRPSARTVWLVEQTGIDPQNPPIAGGGLAGDPAAHDGQGNTVGLTTRYLYDEDLTDGAGLDGSGTTVDKLDGSGTYTVDIDGLLAELEADLGAGFFGNGATGSATVTINPEDELSVTISDGTGRTVASGIIAQNGTPITWQTVKHDTLVAITGVGQVLETTQTDALNHVQKTRSDGAGRTLETVDALSNVTTATFDAAGNQLSLRDANSIGWNATYDARNRQITVADTQEQAESKNRQTVYDAHGNVVGTTDAKSQSASSAFDARDRRVSETDRLAGVTSWRFDENSNLRHLTDAENQSPYKPTAWTYDARNLKITEALPEHNPTSQIGDTDYDLKQFTYDLAGRVDVATDQKGNNVTHLYDMASRLLQRDYRLFNQTAISDSDAFTYGDAGRMASAESGRYNNTVAFGYDAAGRLTSESLTVTFGQTTTYTVQSQYDAANRRTGITYPDGSVVARQYTDRDQLAQIDYNSSMVASFTYDNGSRRTSRTLGDTPGTQTTWTYGRQDNLPTVINSGVPGASFSYSYDANKNKLTEGISAPMANYGFSSTTYDSADRLTAWNRTDGNLDQAWDLSLVGNWATFTENLVQQTRSHTAVHEIAAIDSAPIAHDAAGNLTRNAGDTLDRYTWDFDNRLASADVDQDGTADCLYRHDALGRRVSKTVPDGEGSATTVFVGTIQELEYSPHAKQVLAEYPADAAPTSAARKFVYATYIDEPVMMVDETALGSTGAGSEEPYYYHQNSLYSVAAITDATATVVERYAYSAYGEPIFLDSNANLLDPQASTVGNPYLFTGRRLDEETGLYYYRARMYDAELGRFVGRDPIGADINLYRYCGGNPSIYIDPSGLECVTKNYPADQWSNSNTGYFGSFVIALTYTISQTAGTYTICDVCCLDGGMGKSVTFDYSAHVDVRGSLGVSWEWNGLLGLGVLNASVKGEIYAHGQGDLNFAGSLVYCPPSTPSGIVKACGHSFTLTVGGRVTAQGKVPGYSLSATIAGAVSYPAKFCASVDVGTGVISGAHAEITGPRTGGIRFYGSGTGIGFNRNFDTCLLGNCAGIE